MLINIKHGGKKPVAYVFADGIKSRLKLYHILVQLLLLFNNMVKVSKSKQKINFPMQLRLA